MERYVSIGTRRISMTSAPVFRRAPGVRWREFGSDGILLDPESGEYAQINEIGVLIWESLDQPATLDHVIDRVCEQCEDVGDHAADDIEEFLTTLARRRFLLIEPS